MFWKKKIENKCNSCDKKIEIEWNFCPFCGSNLKKEKNIPKISFRPFSGGFSISIVTSSGIPNISIGRGIEKKEDKNIQEENVKKRIPKKIKETKEPELEIKTISNQKVYIINLPSDIKMNDIEIIRFPNSLEVRAFYNDILYFKIIEIPQNKKVIKKELSNGKLKLFVE